MSLVEERERHGSAEYMEVDIASSAVIGEGIASVSAGVAVEVSLWVGWVREEREGVVWMGWVVDELWSLGAWEMEGEVAWFACVEPTRERELAPRAWSCGVDLLAC